MSENICQKCGQGNVADSKFCNNCGERLSPNTEVTCPNCQTPNAKHLFYCDNCGTRLVKDNLPTEVESNSDLEDSGSVGGALQDFFSLPTRQPGDTGELDINKLPDWLRAGAEGEAGEEKPKTNEGLSTKDSSVDGLPGWLIGTGTDSNPGFKPPSEITTEIFREMDMGALPEAPNTSDLVDPDDINLPDWLDEAVQDTASLVSKPLEPSVGDEEEIPDPFQTTTNLPNWLAELGGVESQDLAEKSDSSAEIGTDWLTAPDSFQQPEIADDFDALFGDEEWVASTSEPEVSEKIETPSGDNVDLRQWGEPAIVNVNLPDWYDELSQTAVTLPEPQLETPSEQQVEADEVESNMFTDWLSGDDEDVSGQTADFFADDSELEEPDTSELFGEEQDDREVAVTGMLTGWLDDFDDESSEEPDTSEPDTSSELFGEEQDEREVVVTGMLTGWLDDFDDETPEESDTSEPDTSGLFGEEQDENEVVVTGMLTGWLDDFGEEGQEEPTSTESQTDLFADIDFEDEIDDVPTTAGTPSDDPVMTGMLTGWLSDLDDVADQPEDDSGSDSFAFDDEEESKEKAATGLLTNWLSDFDDEADVSDPELEPSGFTNVFAEDDSESTSDFSLTEASSDAELSVLAEDEQGRIISGEVGFTEMFADADSGEKDDDDEPISLTELFTDADVNEQVEEASNVEPLPDWLDELAETGTQFLENDEQGDLTQWLSADDEDGLATFDDGFTGDLFADGDAGTDPSLDWLEPTGELDEQTAEDIEAGLFGDDGIGSDSEVVDETPDWFSEISSIDDAVADEDEPSAEDELIFEPVSLPEEDELVPDEPALDTELVQEEATSVEPVTEQPAEPSTQPSEPEAVPDWLTDLRGAEGSDSETVDLEANEEMPVWLSNMKPNLDSHGSSLPGIGSVFDDRLPDVLQEIPEELAGADLPDWLQDVSPTFAEDGDAGESVGQSSDIPDLLQGIGADDGDNSTQLHAILSELPPPRDLRDNLIKADIPDWLKVLKPAKLSGGKRKRPLPPMQEGGVLAGIRGVVEIESVIASTNAATAPAPSPQLNITQEQQQQTLLLRQLAKSEAELAETAVPTETVKPARNLSWVFLALVVFVLIGGAVALLPTDFLLRSANENIPASIEEAQSVLADTSGQTVMVVFDYTPALSGELDAQASMILEQLQDENEIVALSQSAAGTAVANSLLEDQSTLFVPGESVGVRQIANCIRTECDSLYGQALDVNFGDVGLIIVLTGERNNLLSWLEQVEPATEAQMLVGTTQALEPVLAPYIATGQLDGYFNYLSATAEDGMQETLNGQLVAQLLIVVSLILAIVIQTMRNRRPRKVGQVIE